MTQIDYTNDYFLTAAQCNAQRELPVAALVRHIIDAATDHANLIGVGAARLAKDDNTWVLSRLVIEMTRYPRMHHKYSITTWVESFARFFSERNFVIRDQDGEPIGYARTVWVCINRTTRRPSDISELAATVTKDADRPCPIEPVGKLREVTDPQKVTDYTFRVCDIDFNRHVNSVIYAELFVNQLTLDLLDNYMIRRFEINFHQEAHCGDAVKVSSTLTDEGILSGQITQDDTTFTLGRIYLKER